MISVSDIQVDALAERKKFLLTNVKRRELSLFGHVCRHVTLPKKNRLQRCSSQRIAAETMEVNYQRNQSLQHISDATEIDEEFIAITVEASVREYCNDSRASRELVIIHTP